MTNSPLNHDSIVHYIEEWTGDDTITPLVSHVLSQENFFRLPASVGGKHHSQPGGLAQHTWEVLQLCRAMAGCPAYVHRKPDPQVLALAAIWHDMGKLQEYEIGECAGYPIFRHSSSASMGNSHIMSALVEWGRLLERIPCFPLTPLQRDKFTHCIAGHHGKLEWGSPVVPNSLEAIILHHADIQSVMLNGNKNPEMRSREK